MATATTVTIAISDNEGYAPNQIETEVTLATLLESIQDAIEEFGDEAKVVLSNGQRYGAGFGKFSSYRGDLEIRDIDFDEEDDEF